MTSTTSERPEISRLSESPRVSIADQHVLATISDVASSALVPTRALQLQAFLQLPRGADALGQVDASSVQADLERLAADLPLADEWLCEPTLEPTSLRFGDIDDATTRWVCERFHYLRSHRDQSTAFALLPGIGAKPVALAVVSSNDVEALERIGASIGMKNPAVLSRVFAFDGAPRNTISYLLARVAKAVRANGHDGLLTYVNPNVGFSGVSYRASGWQLVGEQPGTRYRYLDGRYITDRLLAREFGSRSDSGYVAVLGSRYDVSCLPLRPLLIFGRRL